MEISIRRNHELRIKAFDLLNKLKSSNISRKEIIDKIYSEFGIPKQNLYDWYSGRFYPYGRRGELTHNPQLFYVLGALFGDGCAYYWKKLGRHLINLVGDKEFTAKYAKAISECTNSQPKSYLNTKRNFWYVNMCNTELYFLFKEVKGDLSKLQIMLEKGNCRINSLKFIEGFFDAEGCVKIIKEKVRKTPKICLDITNTNKEILDIIQKLLQKELSIEAKYSIQKADGIKNKQVAYHLRIYKKEFVKIFFENVNTTKLKEEKVAYVQNWLNNGK